MERKKLMVLDGNSLIYRAFFALPPLKTKDGVHTNGVYGFLTMLFKLMDEYSPEYIGVAFDPKTPTFRHKEYEEYKAGRAKTPDELIGQFDILKEVLDKLGITKVEMDGFEADDAAGTLARIGSKEGLEVILVTGDKDYLQLVDEKTKVLITRKGISDLEIYDRQSVIGRYELTPDQFIDLKGLMGDKSDNIPGVPGVGEKTAIKLLKEFGSIEGIYENIDKVSGNKLRERLIENRQKAFMSKRLARIITDIPVGISLEQLKKREIEQDDLYRLLKELEFNSLIKKMDFKLSEEKKDFLAEVNQDIEIINNGKEVRELVDKIKERQNLIFKFLINGEHFLTDKVLGLAVKIDNNKSYYIDFNESNEKVKEILIQLREVFENSRIKKTGHNLKNDILILFRNGIEIQGLFSDCMIGQYLLDPSQNSYSLKRLAYEYLNTKIDDEEDILGKGKSKKSFADIPIDERARFICNNLDVIFNIDTIIRERIEVFNMDKLYYEVEIPLVEVLANMEFFGFKVDIEKLMELGCEFDNKINELQKKIYELAMEEFNINSPKQLGVILFDKLGLPVIKKTKTGYSTDAEVLEKLAGKHEIIEKILEYRQIVKLKSTYVDGLLAVVNKKTGKVHSSFNQTVTTTGRISSTEPNLQNIPIKTEEGRKIRMVFVPENKQYVLVDADYSQIELRVLAHISDDDKLKEAFYTDEDIHTKTASEVFNVPKEKVTSLMRSRAKAVNFGIIYGISDYGLSRDLKISRKEAKDYIDKYLENYKKVKEYMNDIVKSGKENGYVETILHRKRYLPELNSRNFNIRAFGERIAMNTPIQGSAADIIKVAMVKVYSELKKRKMKSRLILQVHDELIIEAYREEIEEVKDLLKSIMEGAVKLNVPLKVDMKIGDSWYETK